MDFGQGGIVLDHSTWRKDYYKVVDGSKVAGSIAIGKNSVARTGSTILGDHTYNGKIGDTEITSKTNYMNIQPAVFSTTIGSNTYNAGTLATVTGAFSIASSQFNGSGNTNTKNYGAQNTGATIYGSMNSIESATSNDWATRRYSGIASSVLGFANRTQNANAALIWGTGNEITNSIEAVTGVDFTKWNSMSVSDAQKDAIKAMQSNQYAGGSVMAIGGGNKADYATYSELTGVQNKVTGTKAKAAKYDLVNGYQNTVTNASDVTVIGIKNEVTADGNKVIGDNHKVSGKDNVIFGSADQLTETTVNNAVVLGHNAKVTGEGGVALGAGSVADRANAVSVGSKGTERQIINVKAGVEDTDAVNVSQLKKATANANKGWKLSTEDGAANQVASEATVNFSGKKDAGNHQNITVSNDGNNVKIELASELKNVTGVVNGNSRVTLGTGIAGITNGQESVIMMNGSTTINGVVGIDNTGKISGVANGEADKDAVNYGQLKDVKAEALKHSTVTNGDNIAVTETTNKDGGKEYKVALNNDIHLFGDNGAMVSISGSHGTIWTSGSVTAGSVVAGDVVMDSTTATVSGLGNKTTAYAGFATTGKAATEEQLKEVATEAGKHTTLVAGDNVTLDKKETDKGLEYTVNAVDTKYTAGNGITIDAAANNAISVNLKEGEVNLAVDEKGLSLNKDLQGIESISNNTSKLVLREGWAGMQNGVGASVFMVGGLTTINDKVTVDEQGKISGVAAGTADTDAVNYGQLKDVKTEAGKHTTLSDGKNTTVAPTVKDGQTDYKVNVAGDLTDITSVANGGAKLALDGATGTAGIINGKGASIFMMNDSTVINNVVGIDKNGKITGVAAGTADTDAVNYGQLKNISAVATAAKTEIKGGTNIAKVDQTTADDGHMVYTVNADGTTVSGDSNVVVTAGEKDANNVTNYGVKLNKDLKGIESVSNGSAKLTLSSHPFFGTTAELTNGQASVSLMGGSTKINGKVEVRQDGTIGGVTAGRSDKDAVNVSQLKSVGATANMGWNLATNGVATEATNVKPGDFVDFSGDKNISVSHDGTKVKVELNKDIDVNSVQTNALNSKYNLSVGTMAENGIMPFFVNSTGDFYAAHNKFHVDKDGKVTATAGEIGNVVLQNGVYYGHSTLQDGSLLLTDDNGNHSYIDAKSAKLGKVTVAEDGKISGVAAGAVTADSTDAVNGSQLHAVATEAGKHSKVVNGSNINVEEFDNDGQKIYKVNLNKDIMLGDLTGKYVNISGTNGTIETTGYIATKDRVYADKGAKLADIDVTGNKISNGASSIVLDGSNVKVNDKVTIDQNGKISGVAAGEISSTSTDAINGSQLKETNDRVTKNEQDIAQNKADIAALDNRVTQNEADIAANRADIDKNKADIAANRTDIDKNAADIAQNKTDIKNLDNRVTNVEELAKKHTTVTQGDNITVTEGLNADGGKEYNVALNKDINLDSVTTGQTVMNNDGLKVGKDVSVTATAVTAGKTSISDEGVKVGDKTYISDKGLNANDQKVTNVAAGELSATSKDAVNGSQLYATNQEVANNTNRINKLGSRVNKVGAGAAALAALHPMDFDPDDKLTFSAGYGNYAGENAAAIGAYYRPDEKVMFSVAGTVGNGENMVNAGVSFALDRTNHVSNSRTALAREVIDLRGQLAVMGAKMAKMEKAFGMLDETKTKLFPDVPANHWAYEYIAKLAGNGYIEGYPDGNFGGDRLMTRYEFAAMLYRAIENGAALEEKIIKEFEPELGRIRVDRISGEDGDRDKIERVRVNDTKGERDHYGNKLAK